MSKYIDVEKFVADKKELYCNDCEMRKSNGKTVYDIGEAPCESCGTFDMLNDLDDYPDADVKKVKHGEWIFVKEIVCYVQCPCCGRKYDRDKVADLQDSSIMPDYCPNCGAKMDGGTK